MVEEQKKEKEPFFKINPDDEARRSSLRYFLAAAVLIAGMYLSELFHLLEPLFAHIYYGTITDLLFAGFSSLWMIAYFILFHCIAKKRLGTSPFGGEKKKLGLKRTTALYLMTILPILIVGISLNFQFKLVFELGEKVTGVTLLSNLSMYLNAALKLLFGVYFIFLVEKGFRLIFTGCELIPFGGVALMLTLGLIEYFISSSMFSWLYLILCLYYGVIWLVGDGRFGVTYCLSLILYIL